MSIKRVAIYARISPSARDSTINKSEVNQVDFLRQYAKLRNWKVVGEYVDEGYRGNDPLRPRLKQLKAAAGLGSFDAVLVWKVDRLARTTVEGYQLILDLQSIKISLISATEPIDTSTAVGRFILRHLLNFAEFERETVSERTKHGLKMRRKAGLGGKRGPDKRPRKKRVA